MRRERHTGKAHAGERAARRRIGLVAQEAAEDLLESVSERETSKKQSV